jgi:aminopeptidase YwaD
MTEIPANNQKLLHTCQTYLSKFCSEIPERPVGSEGNRQATRRFMRIVEGFNWEVESTSFMAQDWDENGAELQWDQKHFEVYPSPYSLGCELEAELVAAGSVDELDRLDCAGKLLLIHQDLAKEQLMPKNFVFYNPEEHQQIIALLEKKNPAALICATARNASLAGGLYPFPLIEDGDFEIPSVYMTEEDGRKLLKQTGNMFYLKSQAKRTLGKSYQLSARKGKNKKGRIAISAHIDAKKGTPGAIDNATGVIILLLLAELLNNYRGEYALELIPFNGEDYYGATGQMIYLDQNQDLWPEYILNINIDGAGFHLGPSSLSSFDLPTEIQARVAEILQKYQGLTQGKPWVQGDHSIFLQQGIPAIAFSSQWFIDNIDIQDITHTERDHPGIVDCSKLVEIALAVAELVERELY